MVAPPRSRLQSALQTAVQSVDWTYSLFWHPSPPQGVLVWRDGYYNGAINTRKTVEPTEITAEEAALKRSQELTELYDSLISAKSDHQSQRPSATLSPEDLTEAEWFYLLSVSFSFRPGFGLPGQAYEKQKHVWLAVDEVESKISCPRLILAKVEEDIGFIQDIRSLFSDHPKPVISDHSTSTPSLSYQPLPLHLTVPSHDSDDRHMAQEEDDESEFEFRGLAMPDSEAAEPSDHRQQQLMEMEQHGIPAGIRAGLQDDESDSLDPESCHPLGVLEVISSPHDTAADDTVYSRTVSTILQSTRWSDSSSAATAFCKYSTRHLRRRLCGSPQLALKYILFAVPFLHTDSHNATSNDSPARLRRDPASSAQEDLGGSHVLSERRRREKLNERFVTLRSLVPLVTKMDKASILGDTIEYLKHLREKIQELEERTRKMKAKAKQKTSKDLMGSEGDDKCPIQKKKKRRMSMQQESGGERNKAAAQVEVSIIDSDALVEIQCSHKEGLLIDVIQMLRKFMIEVIAVQSSMDNGVFAAELRAKVGEESINGRRASIMEVKRAINGIINS